MKDRSGMEAFKMRPRISVCLATYNGARFIAEQLTSILAQLEDQDEVIVVDDASRDETVAIIAAMQDRRIRILQNSRNAGVISTFERALKESSGEIIFLSDQDDRWFECKIEKMLERFQDPSITLVMSAALLMGADGIPDRDKLHKRLEKAPGVISTMVRNLYQGSLMAFRRSLLPAILPFPKGIGMHDWWIGAVNGLVGKAAVIPEPLVFYRRHGSNVTSLKPGNVSAMIKSRIPLFLALLSRMPRFAKMRLRT